MTINDDIKKTIDMLKRTDIDGCITGSSMIGDIADYDTWESIPDVDLFVYHASEMQHAVDTLMMRFGYYPATKGDEWKIKKMRCRDVKSNLSLQTVKLKHKDSDVLINISWKEKRDNIFAVLSSFDMSIIMVGYNIKDGLHLDLRVGWSGMVVEDPHNMWSKSMRTAVPNPLREQKVDMYGAEMWIRQYSRVIKYWDRGFDTRPMAKFYIELINQVIEDGKLFETSKSEERYNLFVEEFEPLRDQMVAWLKSKED